MELVSPPPDLIGDIVTQTVSHPSSGDPVGPGTTYGRVRKPLIPCRFLNLDLPLGER